MIGLFPIFISSKLSIPSNVFENKRLILFFSKFSFLSLGLNLNRPLANSSKTRFEFKVKVFNDVRNWMFEIDLRSQYVKAVEGLGNTV